MNRTTLLNLLLPVFISVCAFNASAKFTVKVSEPGVVIFNSYSSGERWTLMEEVNEIDDRNMGGELRVPADQYTIECVNETSGEVIPSEAWSTYYRVCVNPGNVSDGDILNVTLSEAEERFITVIYDNPESGYVATLTKYDPDTGGCFPGGIPFDCNEDELFYLDSEGKVEIPYNYEGRIRIRPNEGFSLVEAKFACSNPHGGLSVPDDYGCIVLSMRDIDIDRTVYVSTVEHGYIYVKGTGGCIDEINMTDNSYKSIEITEELQKIYFGGQKYTIRSSTSRPLLKVEVKNGETVTELPNTYGTYYYIPNQDDEVTIHTAEKESGLDKVFETDGYDGLIYDARGMVISNHGSASVLETLSPGFYIISGEKVFVNR